MQIYACLRRSIRVRRPLYMREIPPQPQWSSENRTRTRPVPNDNLRVCQSPQQMRIANMCELRLRTEKPTSSAWQSISICGLDKSTRYFPHRRYTLSLEYVMLHTHTWRGVTIRGDTFVWFTARKTREIHKKRMLQVGTLRNLQCCRQCWCFRL